MIVIINKSILPLYNMNCAI